MDGGRPGRLNCLGLVGWAKSPTAAYDYDMLASRDFARAVKLRTDSVGKGA